VTEEECRRPRTVVLHAGHGDVQAWKVMPDAYCSLDCPEGYQATSADLHVCEKCEGPCPKGFTVFYVASYHSNRALPFINLMCYKLRDYKL